MITLSALFYSFICSLEDEIFPGYLHGRLLLLGKEAAGVAVVHLAGLLSQAAPQLRPLPLLGVDPVEPDLSEDEKVHRDLRSVPYTSKLLLVHTVTCREPQMKN